MIFIPSIPIIRNVNLRMNISLLQHNILVIDILNRIGKRIYLRVNLNTLKLIRRRKIYNSLVDGGRLDIEEEGEVGMVYRWNISFGRQINYAYEIHFKCSMSIPQNGEQK